MCRAETPGPGLHPIAVRGEPAVDEAGDVLAVGGFRERPLEVDGAAHDARADVAGMNIETAREVDLVEEVLVARDLVTVQLDVVQVLAGTDLLLVPGAVPEHKPVQNAEPVR